MTGKARILIVDDEVPVCRSIAGALADQGYVIETALSGEEALERDREKRFDIVIIDLMMPGMTGMQLLTVLKQRRPEVRIIVITGYPSIRSAVESLKLDAFDYLPKPFAPVDLRRVVERALDPDHPPRAAMMGEWIPVVDAAAPEGVYTIGQNAWARPLADGTVQVGIHPDLLAGIGEIAELDLPEEGDRKIQGDTCLVIHDCEGRRHTVWSPVSGQVVEVNRKIKRFSETALADPWGEGWIVRLEPLTLERELPLLSQTHDGAAQRQRR